MVASRYGSIDTKDVDVFERIDEQALQRKGVRRISDIIVCATGIFTFAGLIAATSTLGWLSPFSMQILSSPSQEHENNDEETIERFFKQRLDHFDSDCNKTWLNRYYQSTKYFGGPGKPIFMVIGGEDAMDDGMYYPFVNEYLAKQFQAAVIQMEHRFYGPFQPIRNASTDELLRYLTVQQALEDMVTITAHFKMELGCDPLHSSPDYCPVVSRNQCEYE
jgi:hypothetical protein